MDNTIEIEDIDKVHELCTTIEESLHEIIELCKPLEDSKLGDDQPFSYIKSQCEDMIKEFKERGKVYDEIIEIKSRLGWFVSCEPEKPTRNIGIHPVLDKILRSHKVAVGIK